MLLFVSESSNAGWFQCGLKIAEKLVAISCQNTAIRKDLHITGKILCDCNEVPRVFLEAEGTVLDCAFKLQL